VAHARKRGQTAPCSASSRICRPGGPFRADCQSVLFGGVFRVRVGSVLFSLSLSLSLSHSRTGRVFCSCVCLGFRPTGMSRVLEPSTLNRNRPISSGLGECFVRACVCPAGMFRDLKPYALHRNRPIPSGLINPKP
jgi:hypothetical protein